MKGPFSYPADSPQAKAWALALALMFGAFMWIITDCLESL